LKAKGVNFMGFIETLMKPFSDKKKMGIGTILLAIPLVNIITGIFLAPGYALQTAQKTMKGDKSLPEWDNWEQMVKDSLKMLVVAIVYMIPLAIIMAIVLGPALISAIGAITDPAKITTAISQALGGLVILVPVLILYTIIVSSAIMNVAKSGLGAAFKIGEVIKKGFTVKFIVAIIKAFVAAIIVGVILGIIIGVLALIPFVGFILAMIGSGLMSYAMVVLQYSFLAEGYK